MRNKSAILLLGCLLQACTPMNTVDNYLLGEDNTPKPKELKHLDNKVKVTPKWSVSINKPARTSEYLKLKPVIRGDIIYTADASGLLQAVSKKNGQIKWSTKIASGFVSGPTVADGVIAAGTNAASLVIFSQADGKQLWENKLSGEVLSPPAIASHKVIAKTIDNKVYTFNIADGKNLWKAEHGPSNLVLKASSSPIIADNLVLIGFSDGKLDAYELQTGRQVWQRSIAYATGSSDVERLVDIDADPIVKNQIVYLATYQGYIGALSLTDGQFIWKKPASVYKNMKLKDNTLYLVDSKDVVWSIDGPTGRVNWKQTALKSRQLTEPVLVGQDLILADKMGFVHVIATQTGELTGRSQLTAGVSISPTVSGKTLYVLTDNGMLNQLSVG